MVDGARVGPRPRNILMKCFPAATAALALSLFTFTPGRITAQDAPPPPPSDENMAPGQAPEGEENGPPQEGAPQEEEGAPPNSDGSDGSISDQTFHDDLNGQGNWVQTDQYGSVFQPNVEDPNWAPYTDGRWVYTEDGWTWVSDEPWGWATYHYGRWALLEGAGWVWVPGYRWAPAWVSWRYGNGYCGWAPLPPGRGRGINHYGGDVDGVFGIRAGAYNFVPVARMGDPNLRGAIVNRSGNTALVGRTSNITNINVGRRGRNGFGGVVVNGPALNQVNAQATRPVSTMHLSAANAPGRTSVQGNSLSVFAPRVNAANAHQARTSSAVQRSTVTPSQGNNARTFRPATTPSNVPAAEESFTGGRPAATSTVNQTQRHSSGNYNNAHFNQPRTVTPAPNTRPTFQTQPATATPSTGSRPAYHSENQRTYQAAPRTETHNAAVRPTAPAVNHPAAVNHASGGGHPAGKPAPKDDKKP